MSRRQRRADRQIKNKSADIKDPDNLCGADGEETICICPKCGIEHKKHMFWTGRGVPRIYCDKCYTWLILFNMCDNSFNSIDISYSIKSHILEKIHDNGDSINYVK